MKIKILPYLGFFLATLVFAYFSAGPRKERSQSAQEWLSIPKGSVASIHYEDESKKTDIKREKTSDTYWIEASTMTKTPEGDKQESTRFLASDKLKESFEQLYSFQVEKILGPAKDLKLEEFGLDKPTGQFEVTYEGSKTFKLAIGKRGFQSAEVFVLDSAKQTVLLVNRQFFSPFERAKARLALSSPYQLNPEDLTAATLNVGDKHMEFVRQGKGQTKAWFYREKLDAPDESFRNWLDKVLKLKIDGYAETSQLADIDKLPAKFTLLLRGEKGELDLFAIHEDVATTPASYWFKSKSLPVPVQVERGKLATLLADLPNLLR